MNNFVVNTTSCSDETLAAILGEFFSVEGFTLECLLQKYRFYSPQSKILVHDWRFVNLNGVFRLDVCFKDCCCFRDDVCVFSF